MGNCFKIGPLLAVVGDAITVDGFGPGALSLWMDVLDAEFDFN